MSLTEGIKLSLASALLVVIFALPTLTATQLVRVLGVETESQSLGAKLMVLTVGDNETFVRKSGQVVTVSYLKPGIHKILELRNQTNQRENVNLMASSTDPAVGSQTVLLLTGSGPLRLFDHGLNLPHQTFNLVLSRAQTEDLYLQVISHGGPDYGTISLILRGV